MSRRWDWRRRWLKKSSRSCKISTARRACRFLLAEQNANIALRYATSGYILENGRIVLDGEAGALRANEDVKEFYLGVAGRRPHARSVTSNTTSDARDGWPERPSRDRMSAHDKPDSRDAAAALEAARFAKLRAVLTSAAQHAPGLARQLAGVDIASLKSPADLARAPLVRKSELKAIQEAEPPFGGLAATRPGFLRRLLVSPGPIFEPEGHGADWWGAAPALEAAGLRAGDIVLNCFSYHLTPGGHIMESGALALGCAVIPAEPAPPNSK